MALEQTMFVGDDPSILVDVIENGSHVAATINTTTTRVDGNSAAPTVTPLGTGNYKISFPGLSPAPAEGDTLYVKVNGSVDSSGTAWTEAVYKLKVLPVVPDAVWDKSFSGYNAAGSFGKIIRQVYEGVISTDGQVDDTGATATTFITDLSSSIDDFYHEQLLLFTGGSLNGQSRIITDYNGTTKAVTFKEAFSAAPADGDTFAVLTQKQADTLWRLAASSVGAVQVSGSGASRTLSFKDTDGSTELRSLDWTLATGNRVQN